MLPADVQAFIDSEIAANTTDFSDLRAVYLNGTLKRSPETSNTEGLIAVSRHILEGVGARTDTVRTVDHVIPPGVQPDMREHGWERDDFPGIYRELIEPADIVVLATPIWLGDQSSRPGWRSSGCTDGPATSTRRASGRTTARSAAC